jgi:outer membrane protein assembly factor BamB
LEKGPAFGGGDRQIADSDDLRDQWPAFRHDNSRSGAVDTPVAATLKPVWKAELGGRLSAPTVAAGRLFVAQVDQHQVVCLDAHSGTRLWDFTVGARVDSPPTYHGGSVLFGARDGWLYCLDATSGRLAWRYHVAPCQRWMGAFGQLESAWPIHGSVLVQDDTVYCAAGRSSQLDGGIYLVGLDVASGRLKYATNLEGPHYTVENVAENYNLPMGALPDILVSDGKHIYMRSLAYSPELEHVSGKPDLEVSGGYLEDSYFKRTPWRMGKGDYGRMLVHDKQSAYYVRQFDSLQGLDPTVFFTPGQQGYLLFANNLSQRGNSWRTRVPVRIRAMVLAQNQLLVAGPPDQIDPQDPLGAFEGRRGGQLWVFDTETGEVRAKHELDSPPVFNGTAAADQQLYLVDEQGQIICFGADGDG